MTNEQRKQLIDTNNKKIEEAMTFNVFTLNNTVSDLLKQNRELQAECPHEFVDGFCKYCYKDEDE